MEKPQLEHVVAQCLLKCAQCILGARVGPTAPADKRRSRWVSAWAPGLRTGGRTCTHAHTHAHTHARTQFLLEQEEVPSAAPLLEPCRQRISAPLVLEVRKRGAGDGGLVQARQRGPRERASAAMRGLPLCTPALPQVYLVLGEGAQAPPANVPCRAGEQGRHGGGAPGARCCSGCAAARHLAATHARPCSPPHTHSCAGHVPLERWTLHFGPAPGAPATAPFGPQGGGASGASSSRGGGGSGSLAGSGSSSVGGPPGGGRTYVDEASVYKRLVRGRAGARACVFKHGVVACARAHTPRPRPAHPPASHPTRPPTRAPCAQTLLVRALHIHLRALPASRLARAAKVRQAGRGCTAMTVVPCPMLQHSCHRRLPARCPSAASAPLCAPAPTRARARVHAARRAARPVARVRHSPRRHTRGRQRGGRL